MGGWPKGKRLEEVSDNTSQSDCQDAAIGDEMQGGATVAVAALGIRVGVGVGTSAGVRIRTGIRIRIGVGTGVRTVSSQAVNVLPSGLASIDKGVQGRLAAGGRARPAHPDETVDTQLQLSAVGVRTETVNIGATVQIGDSFRAGAFARGRDDIWVDDLSPGDQGGVDRMEWGTFFELGGRDCSSEGDRSQKEGTHDEWSAGKEGEK